jgi:hypothetical protein
VAKSFRQVTKSFRQVTKPFRQVAKSLRQVAKSLLHTANPSLHIAKWLHHMSLTMLVCSLANQGRAAPQRHLDIWGRAATRPCRNAVLSTNRISKPVR